MSTEPICNSDPAADTHSFFVKDPGFYRKLVLLSVPIVLQNLITFGVIFADNLMVGRLGDTAISGLYMGSLISTVLQITLAGVESTLTILASQYWGRKDLDRIRDVVSIGMRISLSIGLIVAAGAAFFPEGIMGFLTKEPQVIQAGAAYLRWTAAGYLFFPMSQILVMAMRSVEIVRIGLINSLAALFINVCLNYCLIFGHFGFPAMGVKGAAAATAVSRICEFLIVLWFVLKADKNLRLRLSDFRRWDPVIFQDLVRYGTPIMLGQLVWAVNNLFQGWAMGRLDERAITAASITGIFDKFLWMGTWGFAFGTGILVGKAIGEGAFDRVKQYARTMQAVFFGIGITAALIVLTCHDLFLRFYPLPPETLAVTRQFMLVLACIMIGRCYQAPSLYGLVKSGGDTAFVFKNDTFWVFCWILPCTLTALYFHAPSWLIFGLLLSDQITKCFVATVKINRFNWMKDLTRKG